MPNLYNTTLFYSTGFSGQNIPESPALLSTMQQRALPAVFLRQNRDVTTVKVEAAFTDVVNADYCKIGDAFYFIRDIAMTSDKTAQLLLEPDFITTAGGIAAISITDGWLRRAHTGNDELFSNILDEPFEPSHELVIDGQELWNPGAEATGTDLELFSSVVNITRLQSIARDYASPGGLKVTVPQLPEAYGKDEGTMVTMQLPTAAGWETKSYRLPNARLWSMGESSDMKEYVAAVWSIGIPGIITSSYVLPKGYFGEKQGTEQTGFDFINGAHAEKVPNIPLKFAVKDYTVKNNKVFDYLNKYTLISVCTSSSLTFEAHAIASPGKTAPVFIMVSDPTPDGKPFYSPAYYQGARNEGFRNSVAGATWQRSPVVYNGAAGREMDMAEYNRGKKIDASQRGVETGMSILHAVGGFVANPLSVVSQAANVVEGVINRGYETLRERERTQQMERRVNIVEPTITFPLAPGVQNYVGNSVLIYRTRLSDSDAKRLDRFLTMYGYRQDKALEKSDFTNRQFFNYVECERVTVKTGLGRRLDDGIAAQLNGGVRVWHVAPNETHYQNNPIKGGV